MAKEHDPLLIGHRSNIDQNLMAVDNTAEGGTIKSLFK